jgi:pimeloyl-ACP methyl ester carboxylesterase
MKKPIVWLTSLLVLAVAGFTVWLWTPDLPLAELEARYLQPDGKYLNVLGTRLHVRDTGSTDAPTVLMLHGLGSSLHTWEDWARVLDRDFRVIRVDLPGHGLTGADASGDYSMSRLLALLEGMLEQLGLQQVALVGNSMGGRVAWNMAAALPERVWGLVLVSPDGFASPGFEYNEPPEIPAVMDLMRYFLPSAVLRPNVEMAFADRSALSEEVFQRYHDMMRVPGTRAALLAFLRQVELVQPEPLLAKISAPTVLVWGEQDAMIPISNAVDYQTAMPQAKLVRLPGIGHVPQEEAPALSVGPVNSFLHEHAPW